MKTRSLLLFGLALVSAVFVRAETYRFKEPFSRAGGFSSTGTISLKNINGNIAVEAWDKNEIQIEGEKSAETEEELKLIELTVELSQERASIVARFPKRSGGLFGTGKSLHGAVSFKLKVPAHAALDKIETVNSSIEVEGLQGPVQVQTVNGGIHVSNLGGNAELETVNGGLEASFTAITAHQELALKSVNGGIKIFLPADAGFKLDSSTVNGRVKSDFPFEGQGRTEGRQLAGTIGDGRASLNARTVNGGVQIKKF